MQEIFWNDYMLDQKDISNIINGSDFQKKKFIFEQILANSTNLIKDLSNFKRDDLKKLLYSYKILNFNRAFLEKRVKIAKNYFFDEKVFIKELAWIEQ